MELIIHGKNEHESEYEIINNSFPEIINPRKIRKTWCQYFRKKYTVSVILSVSIVIYFYYIYKRN